MYMYVIIYTFIKVHLSLSLSTYIYICIYTYVDLGVGWGPRSQALRAPKSEKSAESEEERFCLTVIFRTETFQTESL